MADLVYEVGKFYRVPCVKTRLGHVWDSVFCGEWVPVIGPRHTDEGAVNFPYEHWHVDWRFASSTVLRRARLNHLYSRVLICFPVHDRTEDRSHPFFEGEVVERRRKCKREFPAYPHSKAQWLPRLQREFADVKMEGMVCPHRGLPLHGCTTEDGVVQCPGHGLRWSIETGALVPIPIPTLTEGGPAT